MNKNLLSKKSWVALLLCTALSVLSGCGAPSPSTESSSPSDGAGTPSQESASAASEQMEIAPPAESGGIELTISAAASLTDVMDELFTLYQKQEPGVTFVPNYGASGTLQTQIEEGAPADLFFSAAQKQMNTLEEKGLLLDGSRRDLLENKVVLIVPKDSTAGIASYEDVSTGKVKTIALGEPKGVPVGQYSEEIFTSLGSLEQVKAKATYGSDVRQVLTWVESGEVDCGVVYATDAATSDKVSIVFEAPEGSCKPVVYPAAILKDSENAETSQKFLDFLSTDEAKALFEKYGFTTL